MLLKWKLTCLKGRTTTSITNSSHTVVLWLSMATYRKHITKVQTVQHMDRLRSINHVPVPTHDQFWSFKAEIGNLLGSRPISSICYYIIDFNSVLKISVIHSMKENNPLPHEQKSQTTPIGMLLDGFCHVIHRQCGSQCQCESGLTSLVNPHLALQA